MDTILSNPILMVVFGILIAVLFFSLLKKLLKLALIIVAVLIIWLGYMHFYGGGIPEDTMDTINQTSEVLEDAVDELKPIAEDALDGAVEKVKPEIEKAKDKVVEKIKEELQ
jgi:glucan phosphoethanolaminetransferase (alkaline phosphatase superfamily)